MTKSVPGADIALRQLRRRSSLNLGAGGLGPFVPVTASERAQAKRARKKGARAKRRRLAAQRLQAWWRNRAERKLARALRQALARVHAKRRSPAGSATMLQRWWRGANGRRRALAVAAGCRLPMPKAWRAVWIREAPDGSWVLLGGGAGAGAEPGLPALPQRNGLAGGVQVRGRMARHAKHAKDVPAGHIRRRSTRARKTMRKTGSSTKLTEQMRAVRRARQAGKSNTHLAVYYYHTETRDTRWDHPGMGSAPPAWRSWLCGYGSLVDMMAGWPTKAKRKHKAARQKRKHKHKTAARPREVARHKRAASTDLRQMHEPEHDSNHGQEAEAPSPAPCDIDEGRKRLRAKAQALAMARRMKIAVRAEADRLGRMAQLHGSIRISAHARASVELGDEGSATVLGLLADQMELPEAGPMSLAAAAVAAAAPEAMAGRRARKRWRNVRSKMRAVCGFQGAGQLRRLVAESTGVTGVTADGSGDRDLDERTDQDSDEEAGLRHSVRRLPLLTVARSELKKYGIGGATATHSRGYGTGGMGGPKEKERKKRTEKERKAAQDERRALWRKRAQERGFVTKEQTRRENVARARAIRDRSEAQSSKGQHTTERAAKLAQMELDRMDAKAKKRQALREKKLKAMMKQAAQKAAADASAAAAAAAVTVAHAAARAQSTVEERQRQLREVEVEAQRLAQIAERKRQWVVAKEARAAARAKKQQERTQAARDRERIAAEARQQRAKQAALDAGQQAVVQQVNASVAKIVKAGSDRTQKMQNLRDAANAPAWMKFVPAT